MRHLSRLAMLGLPLLLITGPTQAASAPASFSPASPPLQDLTPCALAADLVERAIESVPVAAPGGWTYEFRCGTRGEWAGWADYSERTITLHVEHLVAVPAFAPWGIVHEIGHAWAFEQLQSAERLTWRELRQVPRSTPWGEGAWELQPAEDLPEAFAFCYLGESYRWAYRSGVAPPPGLGDCRILLGMMGL